MAGVDYLRVILTVVDGDAGWIFPSLDDFISIARVTT